MLLPFISYRVEDYGCITQLRAMIEKQARIVYIDFYTVIRHICALFSLTILGCLSLLIKINALIDSCHFALVVVFIILLIAFISYFELFPFSQSIPGIRKLEQLAALG